MKEKTIPENEDQCEYSWARKYINDNELIFRNNLLQSFLQNKENWSLLEQSIRFSSPEAKKALDKAFREHLAEIRLISQLSNDLRRHAIRFDQKFKRDRKRQLLILDQPMEDEDNSNVSIMDLIYDQHALPVDQEAFANDYRLESNIGNPALYHAIRSITPRQKYILELSYLFNMSDTEIAAKEGVSQQSISKTRKTALSNVKRHLLEKEGKHE
ncbi:RNA polymerase sigma factor [Oceanobacillus damuensis]|uniref:RNA polymerase sigma factor n=1 Tax=Oceanobacillus damuensis TaxID=937928 RepID=UPI00082C59D5|nr:sigma factor-like helix-turn-helix DNA-binding protein [Oceanobacillus damuensis]